MDKFHSIHLPTDFTRGSHAAFEHALRLALDGRCSLRLFHVGSEERPPWREFPGVRYTLEKWGVLAVGSSKNDVLDLGIEPTKFFVRTRDPVRAISKDLENEKPDLVVMATHARQGLPRLFHSSICKQVVRAARRPTLIVPHGSQGFVDSASGDCRLERILIPVSPEVRPGLTVDLTTRLVNTLGRGPVAARFLYVGDPADSPALDVSDSERLQWESITRQGPVMEELTAELARFRPDLVVMLGRGRDSVLDHLMPGKVEQLTGDVDCPLLVQNVAE